MHYDTCYDKDTLQARQSQTSIGPQGSSVGNFTYSYARNKIELTKFLIYDEQPFTFGESDRYYKYASITLNSCFTKVFRLTTRSEAIKIFQKEMTVLIHKW